MSTAEAARTWGVSLRQVQRLLADDRVPNAKRCGRSWLIPADASKPSDPRKDRKKHGDKLSFQLLRVIEVTSVPLPRNVPDSILATVEDEGARLCYEGELAYLRGDFRRALQCYRMTTGDEASRLRTSLVAVAAAISLGDYPAYLEIEDYLKGFVVPGSASASSVVAELALASVAVSVMAPNMVPKWLCEGDLSAIRFLTKPTYMLYLRAKHLMGTGDYAVALAVARTALAFCPLETGITLPEIYLRVVCALACHRLSRDEEAKCWLREAMQLALPHGFVTPFAEVVADLGGLVEQCLEEGHPEWRGRVLEQWRRTAKNWISFHNHFANDNITSILSLREYQLAQLVARRVPYTKIAQQFNISVGRLKNIMLEIYKKLSVSSRDELAPYVLVDRKEPR